MRVIQVKCPNCAASLKADPEATSIECEYCHTRSAVQRRSRIMQIPVPLAADAGQQVAREKVRRAVRAVVIAGLAQAPLQSDHEEDMLAMTSDRVCTVYELSNRNAPRLTCFDMASGSRTWDTEIAKGVTIVMESLVASRDRVYLSSWGHVQVYDLATGRPLHLIGEL